MIYNEVTGDLIELTLAGNFDVITHGCNCFCTMGAGIAVKMNRQFGCNSASTFKLESEKQRGNINKLGCIEDHEREIVIWNNQYPADLTHEVKKIIVINSYTQYYYGKNGYKFGRYKIPLDYDALTMCLRKINFKYPGKKLGLPMIGCTHGGGDWSRVQNIIKTELRDTEVTVVKFNQ